MLRSIVEGFVQGRSVLKRLLLSSAAAVALVLALGPASALACQSLGVDKTEAKAAEAVRFTLTNCELNDNWELALFFEKPDSQDATPERRTLATGDVTEDTTITGDFTLPDEIGDADQDVLLKAFVIRDAQPVEPTLELTMRYLAPVTNGGGGTGPTGPTGSGSTGTTTPAVGNANPIPLPKRITRNQQRKKNAAKAKPKPKQKAKSKSPAKEKSTKKSKPAVPVAPITKVPTAATPTAPAGGSFQPSLPKPSAGPPPGLGGPPASNGTLPIVPTTPPITPALSVGEDDNALGAPFWLIALLGLLTLLALGGAQTRLLGFWGPLPPMGRDPRDARLLALQRAALSGAVSQKRIAKLKKHTRDRTPVG
jgi:hypothetical protein